MSIDYEAEYNNRARVPEHPEIFARWTREAEDYRAEAMKERRAELGLSYGSSPRQFIDLFSPRPDVTSPLALFIHGGYWRSLDPSLFSHMARGLNAHGVRSASVGYDLAPEVTIAEIIDQIRHACLFMWLRTGRRMMVYGHSAGGHLAGAMVATEWHELYPKTPGRIWCPPPTQASGVFDLTPLVQVSMAQDLRLDDAEARRVSPLFWPAPKGRVFDAVGRKPGIERVPAPEPRHCRDLGQGWRAEPASRPSRDEPFHRDRRDARSAKRHGRPPRRARARGSEPVAPGKADGQQRADANDELARGVVRHHLRNPRADETARPAFPPSSGASPATTTPPGPRRSRWRSRCSTGHQVLGDVGGAIIAPGSDRKHAKHEHPEAGAEIAAINRDRQHHCRRMGEAAHVAAGGGAGSEPRADPPGIGEQHGRETEQQRHQRREYPFRVSSSSMAPISAPTIEASATATNERSNGGSCERS
jgi:arylformamidase